MQKRKMSAVRLFCGVAEIRGKVMTDEEFEMIPKYICEDCGRETTVIIKRQESSVYGVIFENKELCEKCAANRYEDFVRTVEANAI